MDVIKCHLHLLHNFLQGLWTICFKSHTQETTVNYSCLQNYAENAIEKLAIGDYQEGPWTQLSQLSIHFSLVMLLALHSIAHASPCCVQ